MEIVTGYDVEKITIDKRYRISKFRRQKETQCLKISALSQLMYPGWDSNPRPTA